MTYAERLGEIISQMFTDGLNFNEMRMQLQKLAIVTVLKMKRGNQVHAAMFMGMHRNSLSRHIKEFGIDVDAIKREHGKRRR